MAASPFWVTLTAFPLLGTAGSYSVSTDTFYTGPIQLTTTSGKNFLVYCTDLQHNVVLGGKYEFIYAPLTLNGAGAAISQPIANEIGQITSEYKNYTNEWAVAAQAAIWHLSNAGLNPTITDPTVLADYTAILGRTYINNGTIPTVLVPYGYGWWDNNGAGPQELTGVPEPSTWVMMILGFAGLGVAGRRHRNSSRDLA
jgi:hypothetical protein